MAARPPLFTRGLSSLSQSTTDPNSPAAGTASEQRDDAKRNFLKTMRPLPTQHYWNVFFDRPAAKTADEAQAKKAVDGTSPNYTAHLEQLGTQIESVQDFWRYNNNTPVDQIKMRESIYLFKAGFRPVWEDRRNIHGGSWTFRVPKSIGPDVWTRVQLLAIGEKLQSVLDEGDTICGVGLSVRFNSHLISIWHREASKKKSVDALLACVLDELPAELQPKPDNYFYKKHSEHTGFKAPPELQAVLDSQKRRDEAEAKAAAEAATADTTETAAA
ncbi:translation initiation factor [Grosmannia clavigera kw1407]|uniref:Translation initiation factor n=1 Tax=Grosmannia clavigera (strain kw1407 / UAMH 11150) TaxID=655863 RepID=F0X8W0_GROCL|nr:translation initiation factor [Grosmannia clavigera kw1407]EFX05560.1 translation initiation factor [Grosmannia clavigera kw1407]